jgi:hypothetical protein
MRNNEKMRVAETPVLFSGHEQALLLNREVRKKMKTEKEERCWEKYEVARGSSDLSGPSENYGT